MAKSKGSRFTAVMGIPDPSDGKTRVSTDLDFDLDGKQTTNLKIPYSKNTSAWGRILIPIVQFKNGEGPTVLLTAGVHGDEFEGTVALLKLIQRLKVEQVSGRILILPSVNLPAHLNSSRLSPLDNQDLNRSFPGERKGTITQVIAHYVDSFLIPKADVVLDMHSGGHSLDFVPCVVMHDLENAKQESQTLDYLKCFGAPYGLYLKEGDPDGLLDTAVEKRNKIFLSTELRGGGTVTKSAVDIADNGVCNLLRKAGVADIKASKYTKYKQNQTKSLLHTQDEACFVSAEEEGLFEPLLELGDSVKAGQAVAQMHSVCAPHRKPRLLKSAMDGILMCRRVPGRAEAGDCLVVIGIEKPWEES